MSRNDNNDKTNNNKNGVPGISGNFETNLRRFKEKYPGWTIKTGNSFLCGEVVAFDEKNQKTISAPASVHIGESGAESARLFFEAGANNLFRVLGIKIAGETDKNENRADADTEPTSDIFGRDDKFFPDTDISSTKKDLAYILDILEDMATDNEVELESIEVGNVKIDGATKEDLFRILNIFEGLENGDGEDVFTDMSVVRTDKKREEENDEEDYSDENILLVDVKNGVRNDAGKNSVAKKFNPANLVIFDESGGKHLGLNEKLIWFENAYPKFRIECSPEEESAYLFDDIDEIIGVVLSAAQVGLASERKSVDFAEKFSNAAKEYLLDKLGLVPENIPKEEWLRYLEDKKADMKERKRDEANKEKSRVEVPSKTPETRNSSCGTTVFSPKTIKRHLDKYVIGQETAKTDLSTIAYMHMLRTETPELPRNAMLMVGPTGCGKTYMIRKLAEFLKLPHLVIDVSRCTNSGYKGLNIDEAFDGLLSRYGNNPRKIRNAVVYIDECDKLASYSTNGNDHMNGWRRGVQQELLTIVEGGTLQIKRVNGRGSEGGAVAVDTSGMLFIFGGAFPGIENLVSKRTGKNVRGLGFTKDVRGDDAVLFEDMSADLNEEDLVEYGMIRELVGRFSCISVFEKLDEGHLRRIITDSLDSPLHSYRKLFEKNGRSLDVNDDKIDELTAAAFGKNIGARALNRVFFEMLGRGVFEMGESGAAG